MTIDDEAQVCVQTARAWYRVSSAAQEYEPLFLLPLLFARLCKAVIRSIQEMPSVELAGLLVLVCKHLLQTQAKESLLFHIKVCFHVRVCIERGNLYSVLLAVCRRRRCCPMPEQFCGRCMLPASACSGPSVLPCHLRSLPQALSSQATDVYPVTFDAVCCEGRHS